jgi:hypothetical protein
MVMFKARFRPLESEKPAAATSPRGADRPRQVRQQQQQMQQLQRQRPGQQQQQPQPKVPPIEEERGPQNPIREPEPLHEPERAEAL